MSRLLRRAALYAYLGGAMCRSLPVHMAHSAASPLGLPRRVLEQWRLLLDNAITGPDYYMYGLDREELAWERKREFLGEFESWRWLEVFNPTQYRFFTEDKVVFKRYLASMGVPVARLLGSTGANGRAETGEPLRTDAEIRRWLEASGVEQVVLKPVRGARGTGVLVLAGRMADGPRWQGVPAGEIGVDAVLAHLHALPHRPEFMLEARLRPHPDLQVFSPHVVHSARVLSVLDGDVEIVGAALRIASGDVSVDNFSRGNLAASIDLATGRLGTAVMSRASSMVRVSAHPRTGALIEGRRVPDWSRGLDVVRAAARAIPFNRLLGWDVVFSSEGPVVMEANDLWDPDVSQIAPDMGLLGTPLRRALERSGAIRRLGLGTGAR